MKPLCMNSQRPWRNGWQLVCSTGVPGRGADVGQEERRRDLAGELTQVAVAPRRRDAAVQARGLSSPYHPSPKPSALG